MAPRTLTHYYRRKLLVSCFLQFATGQKHILCGFGRKVLEEHSITCGSQENCLSDQFSAGRVIEWWPQLLCPETTLRSLFPRLLLANDWVPQDPKVDPFLGDLDSSGRDFSSRIFLRAALSEMLPPNPLPHSSSPTWLSDNPPPFSLQVFFPINILHVQSHLWVCFLEGPN